MHMRATLPLNNLHAFAIAADCLSFQGAAKQLNVTPSAVSHQVRKLEHLLGYKLFDRQDKHVQLTARGERLFAEIRISFRQIREASRKALQVTESQAFAISVAPMFATRWLLPRLTGFYTSHPHINVSLMATTEMVRFGHDPIDAAIRLGKGHWPGLKATKLFSTKMVAICRPEYLQRRGESFTPHELLEQPRVEATTLCGLWQGWFESAGVNTVIPQAQIQVQNAAQVLEAVQSSDCIGLIDQNLMQSEVDPGLWVVASAHVYQGEDAYYFVCPDLGEPSASLETLRQWIITQADSIE